MAEPATTDAPADTETDVESQALEDTDISFDDADDTSDDTTEEDTSSDDTEEAESDDDASDEATEDDTVEETDEKTEDEADKKESSDSKKPVAEDDQKAQARAMFEKRQQEKTAKAQTQADQTQAYLDEAKNEQELALRQLQVDAYENRVDRNLTKITTGYERALKDFPILTNTTPEIQAELDDALDAFEAKFVTIDQYGNPSNLAKNADLYAFLEKKAASLAKLTGIGSKTQQDNKRREKSKTLVAPSQAPKSGKVDPDMAAFDEEAAR